MAEWPLVNSVRSGQEKETMYLTLVDMFVDAVEPSVIQMILQNRNWDLDAALEDIMILSSSSHTDRTRYNLNKPLGGFEAVKMFGNKNTEEKTPDTNYQNENHPLKMISLTANSEPLCNKSRLLGGKNTKKTKSKTFDKPVDSRVSFSAKSHSHSSLLPFMEHYNYIKSIPFSFSRAVMLIRDGVKLMVILRGAPGSGKSYVAKKLLNEAGIDMFVHKKHVFSSDDFFVQNNVYVFVPDLLSQAHLWNQRNVSAAAREQISPIIVDNTNTQAWEMKVYAEIAVAAGYDLEILEPDTWWFTKESELAKRNVHGVPKSKIRNMIERYEKNITPDILLQKFDLRYSLSNAPPQPANNSKWRDKFNCQKNNKPKKKKNGTNQKVLPQTSIGNCNSMFQSLSLESNDFNQILSLQAAGLPVENENSPHSFIHCPGYFSNDFGDKIQSLPYKMNGVCDTSCLDVNFVFPEVEQNHNFAEIKSSTVETSSSMIDDGSLSTFSAKPQLLLNQTPVQDPTSHMNEHGFNNFLTQNNTNEHLENVTSHNSFDVLIKNSNSTTLSEETKSGENQFLGKSMSIFSELSQYNCTLDNDCIYKKKQMILEVEPNCVSELNQICCNILEQNESFEVKESLESVNEKVLNETDALNIDKACKCVHSDFEPHFANETEQWEYVLVNSDNTFTYKRLTSVPLPKNTTHCDAQLHGHNFKLKTNLDERIKEENHVETVKSLKDDHHGHKINIYDAILIPESYNESNVPLTIPFLDQSESEAENTPKSYSSYITLLSQNSMSNECAGSHETSNSSAVSINDGFNNRENITCVIDVGSKEEKFSSMENVTELDYNTNGNVLGIMRDILNTMTPLCEDILTVCNNDAVDSTKADVIETSTDLNEPKSCNIMTKCKTIDLHSRNCENDSCNNVLVASSILDEWGNGDDWDTNHERNPQSKVTQPKPARSPSRSRMLTKLATSLQLKKQETLDTWNTVSEPLEQWECLDNSVKPLVSREERAICKEETTAALPQRCKPNKIQSVDSSTNTNYLDFSVISDEKMSGLVTITGKSRNIITDGCCKINPSTSDIVLLDKSTMTVENFVDSAKTFDINQITSLFPNIPEKYIVDMIDKCQGDIDWAVDLLLDSEHSIYPLATPELKDSLSISKDNSELNKSVITSTYDNKAHSHGKAHMKRDHKYNRTDDQIELKRMIESSVVIGKSHYSDKILKILKKKHPEYLNLIGKTEFQFNNTIEDIQESESGHNASMSVADKEIVNVCNNDEDDEGSTSSGCDTENEDDLLELIVNNDLVLQLQQKFGNINLPTISNALPVVKLPVSLARQLYGYIMDSLQTDMDEQQKAIESTIAQDEEVARLLQYHDKNVKPQLQEIMDMELAIAVHKADQEEWKDKGHETVAAKLSKNILLEKFPHVDPKMLMEVLHAHNYSLHDTVASLTLALGVDLPRDTELERACVFIDRQDERKEVRHASVLLSEANTITDPLSEAQLHREQAKTYYSLRMECLSKAHEAFRSGNKPVATYYSQLAQMHKDKVEHCNSRAAACLLATHKLGTNTLDLHFLHVTEAEVVLDMFLDEVGTYINKKKKKYQTVFLITGRGLRSIGGISRIKPMVQRKLQSRGIIFGEVNPGMLSALVRSTMPLSSTL